MKVSKVTRRLLNKRRVPRPRNPHEQLLPKRDSTANEQISLRRFDTGLNRLNRNHWHGASTNSINADLSDLPSMMARCANEAAINPIVSGAISTLETDIVGRNGPRTQVISDDSQFNERVEEAWQQVWAMPDPAGVLSGPECLRLWVRMLYLAGSYINVFTNVRRPGPVSFGWKTIHPRRLQSPIGSVFGQNMLFGIELDDNGTPLAYHISNYKAAALGLGSFETKRIPAGVVQHRFLADEPEQITGYPALWPCLDTVADLREYDQYVMEAAKKIASNTPFLEAWSPESVIDPDPLPAEGICVELGQANAAPMGWRWSSPSATQPTAQYREFRHERLRELGLSLGMPLMMVLLSSADSNFASAHYDGAVYLRKLQTVQAWIERRTINELIEQVITELVIAGKVRRPQRYSCRHTWEIPQYINPEKQRKADRMAVEDGAMPLSAYSASLGLDFDEVLFARQREAEQLEQAGLPPAPINYGSGNQAVEDGDEAGKELAGASQSA